MRVILVRHAKAGPGQSDASRTLTPEGHNRAREVAAELATTGLDAVVSSPLVRARQTAEPIAEAAGIAVGIDERLSPGATADDVRAVVAGRGDVVAVVGHQPDLSEIVFELSGKEVAFKPGASYSVEL